jgi:Fur family transcriptional regulator, zinc uptake regulator
MCKSFPSPNLSPGGARLATPVAPRLTRNQDLVMRVLRAARGRSLTAYEVLDQLAPTGIRGPQTVYRALDALREAGLVHRIESLNAFAAVASAGPSCGCTPAPYEDHAHPSAFAVCRSCGAVRDIEDATLGAVLDAVGTRTGYRLEGRVVEMVGTCPDCAGHA